MSDNVRVVAVALFDQIKEKYLIVRRGPEQSGAGFWEFPGGKVEENESDNVALVREIEEELNFSIQPETLEYIGENIHHYPTKSILLVLYRYKEQIKNFQLSEHDAQEWVLLTEISDYKLAEADVPFIKMLKV